MKVKFLMFALILASLGATALYAQTAAPAITLATGTYTMPTSTTITDSTSGASISWCYIASGTCTPLTAYTAAIYLDPTSTETICANATASSSTSSAVCQTYTNGGSQTAAQNTYPWAATGPVGIGTATPGESLTLQVVGTAAVGVGSGGSSIFVWDNSTFQVQQLGPKDTYLSVLQYGKAIALLGSKANDTNLYLTNDYNNAGLGAASESLTITTAGKVGIGTTNPQAALEVNGTLRFTADGSLQTTAWTGTLCGGDYAESVDVTGNRTNYEPGDVLVLDSDNPGKMLKSIEAYSTSVSGIYSTKPGTVGRRQTTAKSPDEVPMAVVGIVPAKVSAENGPIKVGDLLVTSSTPGYAMKGTDRSRMLGAIVGKAMAKLETGTGVIEVLVTLQ